MGTGASRGVKLVLRMGKLDILYTYGDALLRSARPRRPLACASGARSSAAERAPNENWGLARRSNTTLCGFASANSAVPAKQDWVPSPRDAGRGAQ